VSITQAKVAIITVTYNSSAFIIDYLDSISPFVLSGQHKLIIVDNASTDDTCAIINQYVQNNHLSTQLQLIALDNNIGFGKGCNAGANAAKQDCPTYLWLLNPDTKVFKNSGDELIALLNSDKKIDFTGSILVNEHGEPRAGAFRFPRLMNVILSTLKLGILDQLFKQHTTAIPISTKPYQADWLTGASFMVKADCFYHLNGFDPEYFLYFEEVDLFYRAHQAGLSVWACPNSKVFHISGASTGINNHKKAIRRLPKYWFESRRYYYISNHGHAYFAIVDTALILCQLLWRFRARIQNKEDNTPPNFIHDILRHSHIHIIFRSP
jgi:N-acetylglucosaminyl-diphospho-decaprenol L-rhamnosyltransferase